MMDKKVFALVAHPDDIEFMMAGTLFRLKALGWEIHYMTIANGCCGSVQHNKEEIIRIRREEAMNAAHYMGAVFHESLANDLEVFYCDDLIRKITAIVRNIRPTIMLLPALEDYMEDHMNTARIGVTAAFARGCKNYISSPAVESYEADIALYHAMPMGLKTALGVPVVPDLFIDITDVLEQKKNMLSFHKSQQNWLSISQGDNEYIDTMVEMGEQMGKLSEKFLYAEGWKLHNNLGYSREMINPLKEIFE